MYDHARLTRHIVLLGQPHPNLKLVSKNLPFPGMLVADACCDGCLKRVRPLHHFPDWGVDMSCDTCTWSGSAVVEWQVDGPLKIKAVLNKMRKNGFGLDI